MATDILLSKELTAALGEVESKIREGLVTAEKKDVSDKSQKIIKVGFDALRSFTTEIGTKLKLSTHGLHLRMGKYMPHGKYKSHLWSAFTPNTIKAASHVTPQLYIFRSSTLFGWGISPSDAAAEQPEFMEAYRKAFTNSQAELKNLFTEGFVGRGYEGEAETKNPDQFLQSKYLTLSRIYPTSNLPDQEQLYAQIESDLVRIFDLYTNVVESCTSNGLLDRLNRRNGEDTESDDSWMESWNEWLEGPNDIALTEVPKYLQQKYGASWKSLSQLWETGRLEALEAVRQAESGKEVSEERIQALLYGSLRRTNMTGGWRGAIKENFSKILFEISRFAKTYPQGCTNEQYKGLVEKVRDLCGVEAKAFITRILCDLCPNFYLPFGSITLPALKQAAPIFGTQPARIKNGDDYEAICKEAVRLAERHPSLPSDLKLYVFDHFLFWLGSVYEPKDAPLESERKRDALDPDTSTTANSLSGRRFWKISCGRGGQYAAAHKEGGVISIGWGIISDLSKFSNYDGLLAAYKNLPELDFDAGHASRQCWTFLHDIKVGDYVFGYGSGTVLQIGRVTGEYHFQEVSSWAAKYPTVARSHRHTRRIEWLNCRSVETTELPAEIKKRLEHNQTIIELKKDEADQILRQAGVGKEETHSEPVLNEYESVTLNALCEMTAKPREFFETLERRLNGKRQVVFFGPPGTSKTHIAKAFARYFQRAGGMLASVQFHPSYAYEDFIEGFRPNGKADGSHFALDNGVFKQFCKDAMRNPNQKHVFIIDEINRGNLPQIFGELLYLLEYRGEETTLPYSKSPFVIPENIFIVATMNSADRSIAMIDYALRRRFEFFEFAPDSATLKSYLEHNDCKLPITRVVDLFEKLNSVVTQELGKHYRVGHTYFMKPALDEQMLREVWQFSVIPLLEEYFFDNEKAAEAVTFESLWKPNSQAA